jgi:DNA-binding FrmR family transcriptional regulator
MPTLAEIVEKRVHELTRRVDRLESNGVPQAVAASTEQTVVVDTSKYDEVSKSIGDLDAKVMQSLDELQDRVNGLEQLKAMTSAVDGLSLHVELLTKHLEGLVQRVQKLETPVEPEESA